MATPTAAEVLARWKSKASAAQQDYVDGVQQTDKDPTALAIAAGPRYIQQVTAAFNSGKWANGLRRAGVLGWKNAVATKGAQNYSTGVQNADEKFLSAFGPLLAYIDGVKRQIASMPNITDADRDARMLRAVQLMRQYQSGA